MLYEICYVPNLDMIECLFIMDKYHHLSAFFPAKLCFDVYVLILFVMGIETVCGK